jgi:uncharacterized membrane protein
MANVFRRNGKVSDERLYARPSFGASSLLAALALTAVIALLLLPPHGVLDKADRAAFAVCHRIPERTLTIAGRPLPLCARCSGSYLAALTALGVLGARGRLRAGLLPRWPYLLIFGMFVVVWALDGLNSYLTLFPGAPYLYEPQNRLRLATGALQGLALAAVFLPLVNRSLGSETENLTSVGSAADLLWLLAGGVLLFWLMSMDRPALLYPLAIASGLAIVGFAALLNLLIFESFFGHTRYALTRSATTIVCIAFAMGELAAAGLARAAFESRFGWPF